MLAEVFPDRAAATSFLLDRGGCWRCRSGRCCRRCWSGSPGADRGAGDRHNVWYGFHRHGDLRVVGCSQPRAGALINHIRSLGKLFGEKVVMKPPDAGQSDLHVATESASSCVAQDAAVRDAARPARLSNQEAPALSPSVYTSRRRHRTPFKTRFRLADYRFQIILPPFPALVLGTTYSGIDEIAVWLTFRAQR